MISLCVFQNYQKTLTKKIELQEKFAFKHRCYETYLKDLGTKFTMRRWFNIFAE
jgi:hypothetical protein